MNFNFLLTAGITLVVLVIGIGFGSDILSDVTDDFTVNSTAYNSSMDGQTALSNITSKLPTVVTVLMAGIVIGSLVFLGGRKAGWF